MPIPKPMPLCNLIKLFHPSVHFGRTFTKPLCPGCCIKLQLFLDCQDFLQTLSLPRGLDCSVLYLHVVPKELCFFKREFCISKKQLSGHDEITSCRSVHTELANDPTSVLQLILAEDIFLFFLLCGNQVIMSFTLNGAE